MKTRYWNKVTFVRLFVLCAATVRVLGGEPSNQRMTPDALARDVWIQQYLQRDCSLVFGVRMTRDQAVLDGPLRIYDTNGVRVLEWNFKSGVLHGEAVAFYADGRVSSRQYYCEGLLNETELYWNEDGSLYRMTNYVKGKKDGLETYWGEPGEVSRRIRWKRGELESIEFYHDGSVERRLTGEEAKAFFREMGREAAERLLEHEPRLQ